MVSLHSNQKREALVCVIRAFNDQNFRKIVVSILNELGKNGHYNAYYHSVQHKHAVQRALVMVTLSSSSENDSENIPLSQYAMIALESMESFSPPLAVFDCACNGCESSHIHVTDLCQNCVAKPCIAAYHFDAIHSNGKNQLLMCRVTKSAVLVCGPSPMEQSRKLLFPVNMLAQLMPLVKTSKGMS
jgi:hypothetical protein